MLTFIISILLFGVVLLLIMLQLLKNTTNYSFRSSGISRKRRVALQIGIVSAVCILTGGVLILLI